MIRVGPDFEAEYPGASGLATECYANLVRTGDVLIGLHNQQVWEDHRLSATAKQALAVIEGAGEPLEPGIVAERLIITTGSMTSLLDTLEKRGLIIRMSHPQDRRKLLVDITPEGVAIVNSILPAFHQREKTIVTEALTESEQRRLLELLARIQDAARQHAGDETDRTAVRVVPDRLRRSG